MTKGASKSVGSMVGLWDFFKLQSYLCHLLHLVFISPPVASECFFDRLGFVALNRDISVAKGS
jgi:hypothetical protein